MPSYVQALNNGFVHTAMFSADELEGKNIIPVTELDHWYSGSYYDGQNFMRLEIAPENSGQVALNVPLNIVIRWADISGQTVARSCTITVSCNGQTEQVEVVDGAGNMVFESAEPGEYALRAVSPEGCEAEGKVVVE